MSSAYSDLMALVGRFLSSAEISRLRLAIIVGARRYLTGERTVEDIERSAERICMLIAGAHAMEVTYYEQETGKIFIEECKNLVTRSVIEEASRTLSPYALSEMYQESSGGARRELRIF
jgi:hypothetical protein